MCVYNVLLVSVNVGWVSGCLIFSLSIVMLGNSDR